MEDRQEVADRCAEEGLGYFIFNYSCAGEMPDEELKAAFIKVEEAAKEFKALLPESDY